MLFANVLMTTRTLATLGLLLACALGSASVRAQVVDICVDDAFELTGPSGTDDVCPAAQLSSVQRHASCDRDWMRVAVTAGTTYSFYTTALQINSDTVLDLYDGCNQLLAHDDSATSKTSRILWTATKTGAVDLRVTQAGGTYAAGRGYDIVVAIAAPALPLLIDGFE